MPINLRRREGGIFSDVISMSVDGQESQLTVKGTQEHATVKLPGGKVITGTISIVPITVEGGMLARTYVFKTGDGNEFPFGEEILSAGRS